MMKTSLIISLFLLSVWPSFGQDTSFIFKNTANEVYHAIFIEQKTDSKYYDWIADFTFNKNDAREYTWSIEYLKEQNPQPFKKYNTGDLPKQWCSLFRYKGEFYLYSPSDYISNYNVGISDSTYIDYTGEGPMANRIKAFAKTGVGKYQFNLSGYNDPEKIIRIHIVDKKIGIAVFENPNALPKERYQFMVQADKMKNFPIIVNYCDKEKQEEFEGFDKVDFAKWIGKK